jgi:hypothetical protein
VTSTWCKKSKIKKMCVRRNGDEKFIANGAKNKMKKE